MNAYMQDFMLVAQGVDFANSDDAAIDRQAQAYRDAVKRLSNGTYDGIPAQMRRSNEHQAQIHFDQQAANVDDELAWAGERVMLNDGTTETLPVQAYNRILALDLEMDAAVALFPGNPKFAEAQGKTDAWMARFNGRENAADVFEADAVAAARNVTMPAASRRDPGLEAMFRTAWGSSGIDRDIVVIHPRGGWGEKRDELGRLIGQTHDAAIAARSRSGPDRCYLYDFTLLKLKSGGVRRSSHSTRRMACENIPGG